jgi:hypothetical protein
MGKVMELKPGLKLHSAVCDAQVIVVRAPAEPLELACGGAPLLIDGDPAPNGATLDPSLADGVLIGKRYTLEGTTLEVLCTRPGVGSLTADGRPLTIKGAKPLPSSD